MLTAHDVILYQPLSYTLVKDLLAVLMKINCETVLFARVIITPITLLTSLIV
jgi:hypothetical protein